MSLLRCPIMIAAVCLLASACIPMTIEEGSGERASETRVLAQFDEVESLGSLDVSVVPGPEPRVRIDGDDNLVERLVTEIEGRTLVVRTPHHTVFEPTMPLQIRVEAPDLRRVAVIGSGDMKVRDTRKEALRIEVAGSGDIDALGKWERLHAEVAGSGDIRLEGLAKDFRAEVAGSGDIDARELKALRARVEVAGSGDFRVCAEDDLQAEVSGSGDIHSYCAVRDTSSNIVGSGDFIQR